MIDIIIPTMKPLNKLTKLIDEIKQTTDKSKFNIIATCLNASASTNRNCGLNQSKSKFVIMIDDDIKDLKNGWADLLIKPFTFYNNTVMTSARLMHSKTKPGVMMNIKPDFSNDYVLVKEGCVPSACIAFKKTELRFDEYFKGSGFEDTDFCLQMNNKFLKGLYFICNNVQVIHKNEQKNQTSHFFHHNKNYYNQKWFS